MATTRYFAATSLDGYLADADGGLDWLMQFGFDEFQARYDAFIATVGAIVMGARTYEFMLETSDDGWHYGDIPCVVMTHHERAVPTGALVHFVSGDVDEVHAKALSIAGDLDIWMMGGGDVAAQFMQHELIDEFIITIMPVILGSGRPLCPGAAITDPLTLRDVHRFESGAIELTYAR